MDKSNPHRPCALMQCKAQAILCRLSPRSGERMLGVRVKEICAIALWEATASGITPADAVLAQFFYVFAHQMG